MTLDETDPRLSPSERSWLRALHMRLRRPLAANYERRATKRTDAIPAELREGWANMFSRAGDVDAAESF
jgi:hypothetical protein